MRDGDDSLGFSGGVASTFLRSKLTPLVILVSLALGILAIYTTAWEEDPSVTVAVADVFVAFPGRGAADVDARIARPVAAWILEIPSVEHVISSATDDAALLVVQFRDGVERDLALSQLYERLNANRDSLPARVPPPLVVPRGVEDVPVLAVTLWHESDNAVLVRRLAAELASELESLPGVSRVQLTGGSRREIVVELDANRLAERGLGADRIVQAVEAANVRLPAGELAGPVGLVGEPTASRDVAYRQLRLGQERGSSADANTSDVLGGGQTEHLPEAPGQLASRASGHLGEVGHPQRKREVVGDVVDDPRQRVDGDVVGAGRLEV